MQHVIGTCKKKSKPDPDIHLFLGIITLSECLIENDALLEHPTLYQ